MRISSTKNIFMNRYLYLMMLPGILYFIVYRYLPMYGVTIAFKDFRLTRGIFSSPWVGFMYFKQFFTSPVFKMLMTNTILISLYKIIIGFPVPIILALMLNEVRSNLYKKTIQTVLYLPHFISWVVIGNLVAILLAPRSGVVVNLLDSLLGVRPDLLMNPDNFRGLLVATDIWKEAGWGSIIYLAALAGIDITMYEAATIDGAKRLQQIWYITLPSLIPIIVTMFILRLGGILNAGFEQIFIMQNGMVYEVSEVIDTYVYKVGFIQGQYGFSAAVGLFKSLIGLILVVGSNKLAKKLGEEGIW